MLRRSERGQAVIETAIFMPIMIFALYAVFLGVTQGAMAERLQLAVRYGGQISAVQNPYTSYSLYAMYATIDGHDPDQSTCNGAGANTSMLTSVRHSFWQPLSGSTSSVCWEFSEVFYSGNAHGGGSPTTAKPYNFLTHDNFIRVNTASAVSSYVSPGSSQVTEVAAENYLLPASVGDIMSCTYTGQAVKNSLEVIASIPPLGYQYNGGGSIPSSNVTSPLPVTMPDVITLPFLTCNNFSSGQAAVPSPPPS